MIQRPLNCRERVFRAIRRENPDRPPIGYNLSRGVMLRHGAALIDLCCRYPNDYCDVKEELRMPERDLAHYGPDGSYYRTETDAWGCEFVYIQEGIGGEVKRSPFDNWTKLENYRIPPPPYSTPDARRRRREYVKRHKEKYVALEDAGGFFQQMQWLRGVENLFMDIAEERAEVERLADRLLEEYFLPTVEAALDVGADIVTMGDDWGTQQSLLIAPSYWRRVFKPRYLRIFERVHQGGAYVWFHSDGMILKILPDLFEIGVDVINPQCNCMDLNEIARVTAGRVCVAPDVDRQWLLPQGSPVDVRRYVKTLHDCFASPDGGGILYSPNINEDVPLENIEALFQAFCDFH